MLTVSLPMRRFPMVRVRHRWLARQPRWRDALSLAAYYNCRSHKSHPGFLRFPKRALEVDLRQGADHILTTCDESTRYKIRRAARDGIAINIEEDYDAFARYYDAFAASKGIGHMDKDYWRRYGPAATITSAVFEGETMAMHAYFVDSDVKRATLLYSCSLYRDASDSQQRSLQGRANRFLYWDDMRRFAEAGAEWYDFGYFSSTAWIEQVNEFKKGFPCIECATSTYISLPFWLFRRMTSPESTF